MEAHLVENSPYLKASIDTAVDLLCAKLTDYTNKIILKLLMFEAKTEVRTLFQGASAGIESEAVKVIVIMNNILMYSVNTFILFMQLW